MIPVALLLVVSYLPALQVGPASAFAIAHQAVDCVVADKHPRFEARFPEGADVASVKVFFRGASPEWYSVPMQAEGPAFAAVLPSPKRSLKEFHYYIEATSRGMTTARTDDRNTRVVATAGECRGVAAAAAVSAAKIVVQGPAGAATVPSGFANAGLAAAGGGISGTTVAVVGAGVAGAGALAATQLGEEGKRYEGAMSGQNSINVPPCARTESWALNIKIDLPGQTGGTAHSDAGTWRVVTATNCGSLSAGSSLPFGFGEVPLSRSGSAISFTYRDVNGVGGEDVTLDFAGTLSGDSIVGTVTIVGRIGAVASTPLVAPITLTAK